MSNFKKALKTLEYDKILDQLATYAQSQGGKDKARNLVPFEEHDEVLHSLAETEEATNYVIESTELEITKVNKPILLNDMKKVTWEANGDEIIAEIFVTLFAGIIFKSTSLKPSPSTKGAQSL